MGDETVTRVGARELRHQLSGILKRVWEGESFEVTERGKPVARLVPLPERAELWDRLVADGVIIPAERPLHPLPKPLRLRLLMTSKEALEIQRGESPRLP
jgi:prevent-host-death family protein